MRHLLIHSIFLLTLVASFPAFATDLEKAAERGDVTSQFDLGMRYFTSKSTKENEARAYKWMYLAAAQGHKSARSMLNMISRNMQKSSQKLGNDLALKWIERKLAKADPVKNAIDQCNAGWSATVAKKYKIAMRLYNDCIKNEHTKKGVLAQAHRNRGITWRKLKKYRKSLADFSQALKIRANPTDYVNRGNSKSDLKNFQGALSDYAQALAMSPNFRQAFNNRALVYERMGNNKAAATDYIKIFRLGDRDYGLEYPY